MSPATVLAPPRVPAPARASSPASAFAEPGVVLRRYQRYALGGDLGAALISAGLLQVLRFEAGSAYAFIAVDVLLPLVWIAFVAGARGYDRRHLGTGPEEYRRILNAGLIGFASAAVVAYALRSEFARGYVFVAIPVTLFLSLGCRVRLRTWIVRLRARGLALQRVLVVGRAEAVVTVIEQLDNEPRHGLVPVGACVPSLGVEVSHVHDVPVVGDPTRILAAVEETGAQVVAVVSVPDLSGQALRSLSRALEERDVDLIVTPGIIEVAGPRLSVRPIAGLSLLQLERPGSGRMVVKAVFDRVLGALLMLLATPAFVLIALAVRLSGPGPVLYRQKRVRAGGREFTLLTFRSMIGGVEAQRAALAALSEGAGVGFIRRRDPRLTRVGGVLRRSRLDKLPQLLNVVRGDLALVGPRPPRPEDELADRLDVRPGLVTLRTHGLNRHESAQMAARYAENWSVPLDLSILWRTLRAAAKGG